MRVTPRLSQRRAPLTTVPNSATPTSSSTPTTYSGSARRASFCGGMLATIHISTSANAEVDAPGWSRARRSGRRRREQRDQSRRRTSASAQPIRKLSMRRVSTSQMRSTNSATASRHRQSLSSSAVGVGDSRRRRGFAERGSSRTPRARSAPRPRAPKPPFSTSTASAIFGLSAGAKAMNQRVVAQALVDLLLASISRRLSEYTCAVPVLPAIVYVAPTNASRAGAFAGSRRPARS